MTMDNNSADWDWEKLQRGIRSLEWSRYNTGSDERKDALQHTIDFLHYHIEQGDIKSPDRIYMEDK